MRPKIFFVCIFSFVFLVIVLAGFALNGNIRNIEVLQSDFFMPRAFRSERRIYVNSVIRSCGKTREDLVKRYRESVSGFGTTLREQMERSCLDDVLEVRTF